MRAELATLGRELPAADTEADVRLWVDRAFTVHGAGTVVTGTLGAGRLRVGDELVFGRDGRRCGVRGLQSLGRACDTVEAVARVAVNLRGLDHRDIDRGDALLTPDAWRYTREIDVRLRGDKAEDANRELTVHLGAAAVPCRVRPLATDLARLSLSAELPLRAGDRGLLRDPGQHRVPGGSRCWTHSLPDCGAEGRHEPVRRNSPRIIPRPDTCRVHGVVAVAELRALGWEVPGSRVGRWAVADGLLDRLVGRVRDLVAERRDRDPLAPGLSVESLRRELDVPDDLLAAVLPATGLVVRDGVVVDPRRPSALPIRSNEPFGWCNSGSNRTRSPRPRRTTSPNWGSGRNSSPPPNERGGWSGSADGVVLGPNALETAVVCCDPARAVHRQPGPTCPGHHAQGRRSVTRTTRRRGQDPACARRHEDAAAFRPVSRARDSPVPPAKTAETTPRTADTPAVRRGGVPSNGKSDDHLEWWGTS